MQETEDNANKPDPALKAREARRRIFAGAALYVTFMANGYVTIRSLLKTECAEKYHHVLAVLETSTAFTFDAIWFVFAIASIVLLRKQKNGWALACALLCGLLTGLMLLDDFWTSACFMAGW
jgi:hypothetical protein